MASLATCLARLSKAGATKQDLELLRRSADDYATAGHQDAAVRAAADWDGLLREERGRVIEEIRTAAVAAGKDPERYAELRRPQAPAAGKAPAEPDLPGIAPRDTAAQALRDADLARQAEQAKSPPPDDFALTGSDRPTDAAAARGQMDLEDVVRGRAPEPAGVPRRAATPPDQTVLGPTRRPDEIIHDLGAALGVPIRYGHVHRGWLGQFAIRSRVIRRKNWNDLETVAHETGHFLEERFPTMRGVMTQHKGELKPLASPGQDKLAEGFAEYVRLWLSQPGEAARRAPRFHAAFEQIIGGDPKVRAALDATAKDIDAWMRLPPEEQLGTMIGPRPVGLGERLQGSGDRTVFEALDTLDPIKRAVADMTGGQPIPARDDPYKLLRLAAGSDGQVDHFLFRGTLPFGAHERALVAGTGLHGKPLKEVLRPVRQDPTGFERYMVARRADELLRKGKAVPFSRAQVDGTLAKYESPTFRQAFDDLQKYQDDVLRYARDGGLISDALYGAIKKANADYVPFRRVLEKAPGGGRGGRGGGTPIHRLKGSTLNIQDPLQSILDNTALMIRATNQNAGLAALARLSGNTTGGGKWMERLPKVPEALRVQGSQVLDDLAGTLGMRQDELVEALSGGDPAEAARLGEELTDFAHGLRSYFRQVPKANDTRHEVLVRIDGEPTAFAVDPLVYEAIQHIPPPDLNALEAVLSGVARTLRGGVVFDPTYMLRNLARDALSAFIQTRHGFVPVWDSLRGMAHAALRDEEYWRYLAFGGGQSHSWADSEYATRRLARQLFTARPERTSRANWYVIDNAKKAGRLIEYLGEVTESGSRLGEFSRAVAKPRGTGTRGDAMLDAALAGREVSTDFAMHGASRTLAFLRRITPFLNAGIQGLYRGYRAATEDGFKRSFVPVTLKVLGGVTIPSLALYLSTRNEDWYKDLEDWEKNQYWHLGPVGPEGELARIPMPFEWGFFGSTMPRLAVEAWESDLKEREGARFAEAAMQAFGLRIMPPGLLVPLEWATGYNFFTGRPTVGKYQQEGPYDYDVYTKESTKAIAEQFGVSAQKLEQAVRGMSGSLGVMALEGADIAMRMANPNIPRPPERTLADLPATKAFFSRNPKYSSGPTSELYALYEDLAGKAQTLRDLQKESVQCGGCKDAAIEKLSRQFAEAGGQRALKKAEWAKKYLGVQRQRIERIMRGDESPREKRLQIDELIRQRNARARGAVEGVLEAKRQARQGAGEARD